jgi:Ca2+-binding RTX toxin-like protein
MVLRTYTGDSDHNFHEPKILVRAGNVVRVVPDRDPWLMHGLQGNDTLIGGSNNDRIYGDEGNDRLYGGEGQDSLYGGDGSDYLDGGLGNDVMTGGTGGDTYIVDSVNDVVVEEAGGGTDGVRAFVSYTLGNHVETLFLQGTDNLNGTGNALSNSLIGNSGNNRLIGGGDRDILNGLLGNDTLEGGTGDDSYVVDSAGDVVMELANQGTDLVSAAISYTLPNHVENLTLSGSAANNGTGNSLNNVISGNNAANTLMGLDGQDTLRGLGGADQLVGGLGNDELLGGDGGDQLNGYGTTNVNQSQIDRLTGGTGGDVFVLGGSWGVSYVESGDGYALITDWESIDRIQILGSSNQYRLSYSQNLSGGPTWDTEIFHSASGDRIGVVQDVRISDFSAFQSV